MNEKRGGETSKQTGRRGDGETGRMEIPPKISLTREREYLSLLRGEQLIEEVHRLIVVVKQEKGVIRSLVLIYTVAGDTPLHPVDRW